MGSEERGIDAFLFYILLFGTSQLLLVGYSKLGRLSRRGVFRPVFVFVVSGIFYPIGSGFE